ncbi:hypothetical protein KQX54_010123 [Cotesia glomerata]|uniref:Uncharacterized protein n=1 Tax=Cotesia glomerata TaxID=32391 RepID=A0AAV7J7J8_COTGL|nr:hypothetical protein KQX54_010123 [Cotesia glomerata]
MIWALGWLYCPKHLTRARMNEPDPSRAYSLSISLSMLIGYIIAKDSLMYLTTELIGWACLLCSVDMSSKGLLCLYPEQRRAHQKGYLHLNTSALAYRRSSGSMARIYWFR